MKILQVTPEFYPAWAYGGITKVVYELSKKLVERGHEVTVYATDANDKHLRLNSGVNYINGMKIYYFKNISNSLAWNHRLFISPSMLPIIRKEAKNFDIIHIHNFRTFQSILVHHYAKKYDIPYILQVHGTIRRIAKKQRIKKAFDVFFGYKLLRNAEKLIALTRTESEQYRRMGVNADKIEIIPNGIDLAEYKDLPQKDIFRRKFGIRDSKKIILFLGRIHESKGIDLLIEAFADLTESLDNVELVIAGPNDGYLPTLNRLVTSLKLENKVKYVGFISETEKLAAFVDTDVFVTPSFYGFPYVFLEACACSTPIVTTEKGDYIEEIDNEAGYVVQFDRKQLKDALCKILTNKNLRERFGANAKKMLKEYYDWDIIVNRMEEVYRSVID